MTIVSKKNILCICVLSSLYVFFPLKSKDTHEIVNAFEVL